MSWTRRLLVLLAFVLMVGGVALMVIQREEWYLAASVAGFVMVLAAVPSLPRQRRDPNLAERPPKETPPDHDGEAGVAPREWTGNVTVLPRTGDDDEPSESEPAVSPGPEANANAAGTQPETEQPETAPPATAPPAPAERSPSVRPRPTTTESRLPPIGRDRRELSPRRVATAASAAGALLLVWRRLRR